MTAQSLYARILRDGWHILPQPIRRMHDVTTELRASGRAQVERGQTLLACLMAAALRFPRAGRDMPVTVHFRVDAQGEFWRRTFDATSFASYQFSEPGAPPSVVYERLGLVIVALALDPTPARLGITTQHAHVLGLPLPSALAPVCQAHEAVDDQGRFTFDVEIMHPWCGRIVRYRGYLVPETDTP